MKRTLGDRERDFFAVVARAAYANPFGKLRAELDGELAQTDENAPDVLARASSNVARRIEALGRSGKALSISDYGEADRSLLFASVLFDAFHRFSPTLDAFIACEGQTTSDPDLVRFARDLCAFLGARGFAARESVRALELFYQMRRAHSAVATRLIGLGPSMRSLREALWNSLFTRDILRYERFLWSRMEDFSTLLLGDTGTGKGEAASAIGRSGFVPFDEKTQRFLEHATQFVPIHLSEFPETLLESELFGHRKGAFTGAVDHHEGVLGRTRPHGTLFLDEIGEVSLPVQVKLLRVLQERTYVPVGGHESRRFSGRIVAATHRSIENLRDEGRMRDDFFFRLSTHTITLPSLRTRLSENPSELRNLVSHLCTRIVGSRAQELSDEVHQAIERDLGPDHPFAGNVRELEQCVRRVLLTGQCLSDSAHASSQMGTLERASSVPTSAHALLTQLTCSAEELVARYCAALYERHPSYVEVARITGLDRRTVKKQIDNLKAR